MHEIIAWQSTTILLLLLLLHCRRVLTSHICLFEGSEVPASENGERERFP